MDKELRLPPGQQLVSPSKWPVIGERLPAQTGEPWELEISGEIATPTRWSLEQLRELPQTERTLDIHCVTRWSKYDVTFGGVLLSDLLEKVSPNAQARFASFIARSERSHSTSLPLDVALAHQTLIALSANGEPLPEGHGGPIRNIVPRKYFYKSVKWLTHIEILSEDRLGYWEAETGYHNGADPWQEERYMAPTVDRRTAARLIATLDFSGQDLRSIDASRRDLTNLNAEQALLRDANFENCQLTGSCFNGANLSNAHFRNANLQQARFVGADLEGADFTGADLRGADLSGCSLIGASFAVVDPHSDKLVSPAQLDSSTKIDPATLEPLTEAQATLIRRLVDLPLS